MEAMHLVCKTCIPIEADGSYTTLTKENSLKLSDWQPGAGYTLMAPFEEDMVQRSETLEKFFADHRHMEDRTEAVKHNFDMVYESEASNA